MKIQLNIEAYCAIDDNKYESFAKKWSCFVGIIWKWHLALCHV